MGKKRFASTSYADQRSPVSRYGTEVRSHTRGWDIGVEVVASVDQSGNDTFEIWVTGGSTDSGRREQIGTVTST